MVVDSKNNSDLKLKNTSKKGFFSRSKNKNLSIKNKEEKEKVTGEKVDDSKRLFLKIVGAAGLGLVASSLFPNRANAYIAGSSPTSNSVAIKNLANQKINPATEDTLATLAKETTLSNIKTNTDNLADIKTGTDHLAGIKSGTDHLTNIETNTGKFAFDDENNLKIAATALVAGNVNIKDATSSVINPATDESIIYLRRMVKLMESQATVDVGNRQRISIDAVGAGVTVPVSATLNNIATLASQGQQMFQDPARTAYAIGIRNNLSFS